MFLTSVPDFYGGAERVLWDLIENPAIVPLLAVPGPGQLSQEAERRGIGVFFYRPGAMIEVHRPVRLGAMLRAVADAVRCGLRIRRFARQSGCDIVHSNSLKTHVLLGIVRAGGRGLRCIVHLHDIAYTKAEKAVWRSLGACAHRLVVVSPPCWPTTPLPSKVAVIPNGLNVDADSPPQRHPARPLRLGFVGRFHPNKSLEVLLDWFAAARRADIDCRLVLRGRPDPVSEDYWLAIRQRIDGLGLADRITTEGWRSGAGVYEGLDVVIVPSKVPDPLPRVVMEAMGAGLPVVAYPSGGIPTMIASRRTGFLAESPAQFVEALRELTADGATYDRIRCAGFAHVKGSLTMEHFHARVNETYRLARGS
ncbi:MAG TPA: glycosyltransferase family 4 protein [Geminicoccaceae bacterium]|nr:glycosyltransferase family 4 protein [Geminicoccus sp.]HMU51148.1 glycosyltransferase family 4 protein [Geminicoccaceae bacterium]